MSADDVPVSSLVTPAEVARTRSLLIDEVDGLPSTHTASTAVPARTVSLIPHTRAPHSFAAKQPPSRAALVPWWSLLLSVLALAVIGSLIAVIELPAVIGAAVSVCVSGCCLALVVAELVHRATAWRSRL